MAKSKKKFYDSESDDAAPAPKVSADKKENDLKNHSKFDKFKNKKGI